MNLFFQKKRKLKVLITGNPRSGTSFLAGYIAKMGFSLGKESSLKKADINNRFGYFENEHLLKLSYSIIDKLGYDFHYNIPYLNYDWTAKMDSERKEIVKIVTRENIELYKDNRLLLIGDLYNEIYPDAKWIYISRNVQETYRSRFGKEMSFENWQKISKNRYEAWKRTKVSEKALSVDYSEFMTDIQNVTNKILYHLEINSSEVNLSNIKDFFQPKEIEN